jgi:hypothetical protein
MTAVRILLRIDRSTSVAEAPEEARSAAVLGEHPTALQLLGSALILATAYTASTSQNPIEWLRYPTQGASHHARP